MKVFVHIGMHKTGTSSVQHVLMKSTEKLLLLGYCVLVNNPQINIKNKQYYDPTWVRDQVEKCEAKGMKAIIFSAEMISTFNSEQMKSFFEIFHGYEVCVIAGIRHWVNFLPSRWAQNCSRRDSQSFPAYLDKLQTDYQKHIDVRFDLVVSRVLNANPAKLRLVSFDNAILNNSVLPTILSAFDLPDAYVDEYKVMRGYVNKRQDIDKTELVRLFNGVYSSHKGYEKNELFKAIYEARRVNHFYDFNRKVSDILRDKQVLRKKLLSLIEQKKIKISLSSEDEFITNWHLKTEELSQGFIYNPIQGKLFSEVLNNEITCSTLEAKDLHLQLKDEMLLALDVH